MHLFVNGTSVASGVGTGGEKFKGLGDGDITTSWAHFLANMLNCDRLWNHSLPSKPMSFTIADTIGFCEQYWQKYGTYDNLFAVIEWLMPQAHGKWGTVSSTTQPYQHCDIFPVVVSWPDTPTVFETMYLSRPRDVDYLSNRAIYEPVSIQHIDYHCVITHEQQRDRYYNKQYNLSNRLAESAREIQFLKNWLTTRNIRFVMFWAYGVGRIAGMRKLVDRAVLSVIEQDGTFIPIKDFAGGDAAYYSQNPVRGHPDIHGQKYIADYLYNYIAQHRLLAPSTLIHT